LVPGSHSDNQANPETSTISYNQAAKEDPSLSKDVDAVATYKQSLGESPLQTVANGANDDKGTFSMLFRIGGALAPEESIIGKISDFLSGTTEAADDASPERITREHDADKGTYKYW
jgi:hypothetical protein